MVKHFACSHIAPLANAPCPKMGLFVVLYEHCPNLGSCPPHRQSKLDQIFHFSLRFTTSFSGPGLIRIYSFPKLSQESKCFWSLDDDVCYDVEAHVIASLEESFCNVPSAFDIVLPKTKFSNVLLCSSVHPFIGGFILLTFSSLTLTQPDPCRWHTADVRFHCTIVTWKSQFSIQWFPK